MLKTLAQIRDSVIHAIIQEEVDNYCNYSSVNSNGRRKRRCAYTGKWFYPKNRYHFFINAQARKNYYRGQFKPRD